MLFKCSDISNFYDLSKSFSEKVQIRKVIIWHKFDPISCCWQDHFTFFRHAFLPKVFVCLFRDSRFRLRLVLRFSFVRIRKTVYPVYRSSRDDVLKNMFRNLFLTCKRLEEVPYTIRKCSNIFVLFLNPYFCIQRINSFELCLPILNWIK